MDSNHKGARNFNNGKSKNDTPPGPVFQGIGTRLRRSRSKDHSNEFDNLSTDLEISNLKQSRTGGYEGFMSAKGGTLERPKRLYNFSPLTSYTNGTELSSQFVGHQPLPPQYVSSRLAKNNSSTNIYDDSHLLAHQYEEPHLIMDYLPKDSLLYESSANSHQSQFPTNRRRSKDSPYTGTNSKHTRQDPNGDLHCSPMSYVHNSYVVLERNQGRGNTTVIPPSKLFAKTLNPAAPFKQQESGSDLYSVKLTADGNSVTSNRQLSSTSSPLNGSNSRLSGSGGGGDDSNISPARNVSRIQNGLGSDGSSDHSGATLRPNPNDYMPVSDAEATATAAAAASLSTDHHHRRVAGPPSSSTTGTSNNHSGSTYNDLAEQQDVDNYGADSPPKLCLTSSSHSSVMMHTYANPFQNCSSSFSEDTTGPIIPDLNTLRPSQLLKNSFSGSGQPPNLQSSPKRNVLSYFANRLWSYLRVDQKSPDLNEHRCSWRLSTLTLIVLVVILLIVIITLSGMNSDIFSAQHQPYNSKVPCIVVEDLDSTSSNFLSSSSPSSSFNGGEYPSDISSEGSFSPPSPSNCPMSLPRNPLQFKELPLQDSNLLPFSFRLAPYTSWPIWFSQTQSTFLNFQFYAPVNTRLALLAHKNEPPSLTSHQLLQVISEETLGFSHLRRRATREPHLVQMQFVHYFEQGSWYISLVNDADQIVPLVVNVSTVHNMSTQCPSNCHNHGYCHIGKCQCFPGFIGQDCADNVCPVLCGGHGQYLQGSCRCESGWKGKECTIRADQCEVADCNGNGLCLEGSCQCRTGSKGEHCEQVDCADSQCSKHGVCVDGVCICKASWTGTNCSQPDTKLHQFFPNCSKNGVYDFETGQCMCYSHYSGPDCSKFSCSLDCGQHGFCKDGVCECEDGWSGTHCELKQCDYRCLEHGQCLNGTCFCEDGWMGQYCTLDGCPNFCSKHGRCVSTSPNNEQASYLSYNITSSVYWSCQCDVAWTGRDCSFPQEISCNDEHDNDQDGLVDCADSECCRQDLCGLHSLMCITSPDPLDILLRKQPPSPISSFFQKVHFLIEDSSVQSYAQKDTYNEKRVSVIRGQVVSKDQNGIVGVRVSVSTEPQFGFTLTRFDGWFDILVNGGGIVTLQFQRNPFISIKISAYVAWNDIAVIQNPIVMYTQPSDAQGFSYFNHRASSPSLNLFSLLGSGFGEINWSNLISVNKAANSSSCLEHNYELMKPTIRDSLATDLSITKNTGVHCADDASCIIAETQVVHETVQIGASNLHLVYQTSMAQGYLSTLFVQLTPSTVPKSLRFVFLRILIEGSIHEKIFEADPDLKYTFAWNKRNVYKQKVYGFSNAKVFVGYIYHDCSNVIWNAFHARLRGYDMEISELGSWNLDIHHRYNLYDNIFQRGDGQIVSFKDNNNQNNQVLLMEPLAGSHHQARPFICTSAECPNSLSSARFFSLLTLTSGPDGSVFVGDANLIRRITPDGRIYTVYQFKAHSNRQTFEYYISYNSLDQYLYISDPEKFQVLRIQIPDKFDTSFAELTLPDVEVYIGTGERCLPRDKNLCGDGRTGLEVQLLYPKGLAFGLDGSLFFADGNVIRVLDTNGYVHRIAGEWNKRQWKPVSCQASRPSTDIKLHWPTSLAVNQVDGALYFVDNYVLFKLNQDLRVSIVAGYPAFCLEENTTTGQNPSNEHNCQRHKLDAKMFAFCGEDLLFGSVAFAPTGILYITDISRQSENRVFALHSDGSLVHVAGYKSPISERQNCSVERCSDISGQNCTCLISNSSSSEAAEEFTSGEQKIGTRVKLFSVTALTVTGDGTVILADEGSLQLLKLKPHVPQVDDQMEIKILSPNLGEMYVFNQYGQHIATRSIVTGRVLYNFYYTQDNSFGKLAAVTDASDNKLSFIRDPTGALHTIESSSGLKYRTVVNKLGLLEQIVSSQNTSLYYDYYTNGLIHSKAVSSTGQTYFYFYDQNGRLIEFVEPSGVSTLVNFEYSQFEETVHANQVSIFGSQNSTKVGGHLPASQFKLNINSKLQINVKFRDQSSNVLVLPDGSFLVNSSHNLNAYFGGKSSKLSHAMLPFQALMFPVFSHCRIQPNRESSQALNFAVDYGLKMKSSVISAVEKFVYINDSLALKLEYDWKANREIFYNQSQRPILFLQFDENGRPIQWMPNMKVHQLPYSFSFDKFGLLASWQDGVHTHGYIHDRAGRLSEVRQMDSLIRYQYAALESDPNNLLQLPSVMTLRSGHKYGYEFDSNGRVKAIITPKGTKYEFNIKIVIGFYKFAYCPPIVVDSESNVNYAARCFIVYFDEHRRPLMKVLPFDSGKLVYRYATRLSHSKHFAKDLHRSSSSNEDNLLVDQIIFGNGLVERWYDAKSGKVQKGIWRNSNVEFVNIFKYSHNNGLVKHQSYQFSNIRSVSQLVLNYRYDGLQRLKSIQAKLGSINLPIQEFSYAIASNQIETIGNFRYFNRNGNETMLGDGVALFSRRYDPTTGRVRHQSVTIADKEVFRADYVHNALGNLAQTRTFMRHLGANKIRLQNFTYDLDGQLVEVQGREHWRFVYDSNGNFITFLYRGNRIDLEYDSADRIKSFGKGQQQANTAQGDSSPYVTDGRGFVIRRGNEHFSYNNLGQLLSVIQPDRYEVSYNYDYRNRLVVRRDYQNNVTQYFYGNPQKPHLVTHAFNNADGRVLSLFYDDKDDSLIMIRVNNENFYVVCDQTKSPLLVLDHRGQVVKEIHRTPYGHSLFDSNPNFYLPIDFHGGIPDPLTNLVHFVNNRVYDTFIGRWLTPQIDDLLRQNIFENPRTIYNYQFVFNDPINVDHHSFWNDILSLNQAESLLQSKTSSLIEREIGVDQLALLKQFDLISPELTTFPIQSSLLLSMKFVLNELQRYSSFKSNYFSKLANQDWTSKQSMWSMISMQNAMFGTGILFTKNSDSVVEIRTNSHVDSLVREFVTQLVNGSHLLDLHLVMGGRDQFYLVKQHSLEPNFINQLKIYQHVVNFTVQETHTASSEPDIKPMIDILVNMDSVTLNIRYGTTVAKERDRVLRLSKKYAFKQLLAQERTRILHNSPGIGSWSEEEKQFIMLAGGGSSVSNSNGPFRTEYYHSAAVCSELAEDPSNLILRSKRLGT